MYECQMKMSVPPGVGLLVAGLASGICFLIIGSLRKGRSEKIVDDSRCACCLKPFFVGQGVRCSDCGARSCRRACCRWDSVDNAWFCLFCYHKRSQARRKEKWFRSFGGSTVDTETCENFSTAKSRIYDEGAENVAVHSELELAAGGCEDRNSMETVRECVEKMVDGLVGNVDDTPIDRLYDHPSYDRIFEAHGVLLASTLTRLAMSLRPRADNKPATDTPTMAHTALRELVEHAVDEARKLPSLGTTVSTGVHDDSSFSDQNYEDLLATAILNKVIEKFQNERVDDNSNVVRQRPRSGLANHENETGLDEGLEEDSSGLEPLSHDDRSSEDSGPLTRQSLSRQTPLSLTIEEQIEEVTTTYTSNEEIRCSKINVLDFKNARRVPFPELGMDIIDPSQDSSEYSEDDDEDSTHVDRITPAESWETNWLFQRRKIKNHSNGVAMLVPNPISDFRALIGDVDAEDTSDLSECSAQSDDEIENEEFNEPTSRPIDRSRKIGDDSSSEFDEVDGKIHESIDPIDVRSDKSIGKNDDPKVENNVEPGKNRQSYVNDTREDETMKIGEKSKENNSKSSTNFAASGKNVDSTSANTLDLTVDDTGRRSIADRAAIGDASNVEETKRELAKTDGPTIVESESDDYFETKNVATEINADSSEIEGNRHSRSSAINGCVEIRSRDDDSANDNDRREIEGNGDPWDGVTGIALKDSLDGEIVPNGNAKGIKNDEIIENFTSHEDTHRKCQALAKAKADSASEKPSSGIKVNEIIGLSAPPRPGTIAEREHKKWENAAPIENNPYSEENIQKRLLERQYARRSSDVSGNSTKLQTSPSPPLQIVLGASRRDFKRFGRDYYINEAKFPRGHSIEDNGFVTATSRPGSSLSRGSSSIGSDYEQQERSGSVETDSTCSTSSDSKTKIISETQQNNSQLTNRRESTSIDDDYETGETHDRNSVDNPNVKSLNVVNRDETWNDRNSYDDILESERKNSKNVINARLNNRGNFDDNRKPIKRIDLRSYGFENEFNDDNRDNSIKSRPVVSKLDLKSFGYDSGLRRTQSIGNIDRPIDRRCNVRNFDVKSNLIGKRERFSERPIHASLETSDDEISPNDGRVARVEDANRRKFGGITIAKSVPNIGDLYAINVDDNRENDRRDEETFDNDRRGPRNFTRTNERSDSRGTVESNCNVDRSIGDSREVTNSDEKKLPMPSVRKLAQAFNRTESKNCLTTCRPPKFVNVTTKERPTTPEIHIVDTPRQMHSLTARSLSREFREGLRQIVNKRSQPKKPDEMTERERSKDRRSSENFVASNEDVSVIAPGKLKNDIQFWEQLNRQT